MPKPQRYAHTYHHKINWGDMDAFGHVNNVTYARYFESARVDYLIAKKIWSHDLEVVEGPVMINQSLNYRKQVRFPATLEITIETTEKSKRRFEMSCTIWDEAGDCVMVCTADFFWFDFSKGKPVSIPEAVFEKL